jgi:hypothetical protein
MSSLALALAAVLGAVPMQAQALGTRQFVDLDGTIPQRVVNSLSVCIHEALLLIE